MPKKVRIQSPIVSPDEPQDDPFDVRLNPDGHPGSPPPLDTEKGIATELRNSFIDSVAQGTSSLNSEAVGDAPPNSAMGGLGTDKLATQAAHQAPYNPFARTLASIEPGYGASTGPTATSGNAVPLPKEQPGQGGGTSGKGIMDVDAFTKMLLTGNSGTASPIGLSKQTEPPGENRSEGISLAPEYRRPSMFDSISQIHPESPQLSYDERSSDDEDRGDDLDHADGEGRSKKAKPPPPQHHHGKRFSRKGPQTVSFADFDMSAASSPGQSPVTPGDLQGLGLSRPAPSRSISDLNKPLPLPPVGSFSPEPGPDVPIKDEEIMSINEPEEQIDQDNIPKNTRPAPPVARRSSQTYAKTGRTRSSSNLSKSSVPDDFGEDADAEAASQLSFAQSLKPPPPPSRRAINPQSGNGRDSSVPSALPGANMQTSAGRPPPPPPSRGTRINPGLTRTPSSQSTSSLGARRASPSLGQPPPPPPPRRSDPKRTSIDGSRYSSTTADARRPSDASHRGSAELRRLSGASWNSGRTPSISSLQNVPEDNLDTPVAQRNEPANITNEHDILGDMAAFQREIDELRARVGK